jgi:class 3 adenylate cyclase
MVGAVGTFGGHLGLTAYYVWISVPEMVRYHYFGLPLLLTMALLMKRGAIAAAYTGIALEFVAHAWFATHYLGLSSNLHTPYLGAIIAVAFVPLRNKRMLALIELMLLLAYMALLLTFFDMDPVYSPPGALLLPAAVGMPVFTVFLTGLVLLFLTQTNQRLFERLGEEQAKTEALLLNVLPKAVADRLRSKTEVIADRFDSASVLFVDIVGFTSISSVLSPTILVTMLDSVFRCFDNIVERHGLEKIKTIGDAYMAAAGVPDPCPDHARRTANAALEMLEAMSARRASGSEDLHCRVGICSGPIIAGVIGRKRFLYDLWGDTVNTASRMESHGVADQIQVTASTYDMLKHDYHFEPRGEIMVKGKGAMKTWILTGR